LSALAGDMVVERGAHLNWYAGPTLLEVLHQAPAGPAELGEFRFPVQLVSRPGIEGAYTRGYMGRIESGRVAVGDTVVVLPGGQTSRVSGIVTFDGNLETAAAPHSVTLLLEDEIDVSRGDLISHSAAPARALRRFDAMLCWMDAERLDVRRKYIVKQATRSTKAVIERIDHRLDIENFEPCAADDLGMNEIGQVSLKVRDALSVDAYAENRATGGFILIDEVTNHTVAAGMILALDGTGASHG
jgi:sulfate adenylyltransferase subunit 1